MPDFAGPPAASFENPFSGDDAPDYDPFPVEDNGAGRFFTLIARITLDFCRDENRAQNDFLPVLIIPLRRMALVRRLREPGQAHIIATKNPYRAEVRP